MRKEWVDPSLARGCWHAEPFSSLREFLAGVQAVGALDGALPARPSRGPLVDLVTTHEAAVADVLLGERRADDLRTISWSAHPTMVTVPLWRAVVGEALDVSRQLTGLATPPTVEGVLGLVESGDLISVARHVAPDHGFDPEDTDWVTMSRWVGGYPTLLLTAVVGMAAIDSGRFRPRWSWPDGTSLVNENGWVLPLHPIANEVLRPQDRDRSSGHPRARDGAGRAGDRRHRAAVAHPRAERPSPAERPTGSFVAYQGLGSRQVIVTDRALHVFGRPWSAGLRNHYAMRMRGADELRTRMLRVWQGDETDQTAYLPRRGHPQGPVQRPHRRLALAARAPRPRREADPARASGTGARQEEQVAALLGDRLTTSWLHSPRELLAVRNAIGRVGMVVAGLAAARRARAVGRRARGLARLGGTAARPGRRARPGPGRCSRTWSWRSSGRCADPPERPEPLVVTRRYARSAPKAAPEPLPAFEPRTSSRSASTAPRWTRSPWTSATCPACRTGRTRSSTSTTSTTSRPAGLAAGDGRRSAEPSAPREVGAVVR